MRGNFCLLDSGGKSQETIRETKGRSETATLSRNQKRRERAVDKEL